VWPNRAGETAFPTGNILRQEHIVAPFGKLHSLFLFLPTFGYRDFKEVRDLWIICRLAR
jgi:hypothetical protein